MPCYHGNQNSSAIALVLKVAKPRKSRCEGGGSSKIRKGAQTRYQGEENEGKGAEEL